MHRKIAKRKVGDLMLSHVTAQVRSEGVKWAMGVNEHTFAILRAQKWLQKIGFWQ